MKTNKKNRKHFRLDGTTVFFGILGLVLCAYAISLLYPLAWGLMNTFKHFVEFGENAMKFPNFSLWDTLGGLEEGYSSVFGNYTKVFTTLHYKGSTSYYSIFSDTPVKHSIEVKGLAAFFTFFGNSLLTAFAGVVFPTMLSCMMGYLAAKYKFRFSRVLYTIVIFVQALPIVGQAPAMLTLQRNIGFYDNMIGYMIWNCNWTSMYFLMYYAFFLGLSDSYFEAAEIDGASQLRMLIHIAIPLASTMIYACFVLFFVNAWNDYATPLMYLPTHPTLAFGIYYNTMYNTQNDRPPIRLASLMYLCIPSLIIFILFRDKLMGNLSLGGVKE